MLEGLTALLIFLLFLWEWPRFIKEREAAAHSESPDPLVAAIRRARIRAGLTPWPEPDDEE